MLKKLNWYNDRVLDEIRSWGESACKEMGHQMRDVSAGEFPPRAKWLPMVGDRVVQLKDRGGHRIILAVEIDAEVWALHAFKKDAAKGNTTRKHHMDLAKQRLDELLARNIRKH